MFAFDFSVNMCVFVHGRIVVHRVASSLTRVCMRLIEACERLRVRHRRDRLDGNQLAWLQQVEHFISEVRAGHRVQARPQQYTR